MFLLILDKDPYKAAELIPDRLKFKQLLELGQLICSAGISDVYKPIKQGKELQEWIKNNPQWVYCYLCELIQFNYNKFKDIEKRQKIIKINADLYCYIRDNQIKIKEPTTAIFRYVKEYAGMTSYESNSELPIDVAISEYKRYLEYKEKEYNNKRLTNDF